jgi:flagella basal body P-ring formation protein FlgA
MGWLLLCLVVVLAPMPALADSFVANRVVRAGDVIRAEDLSAVAADIPGALSAIDQIAGQEARVTLYPGRPIRADQLGAPAVVDRNQIVSLAYLVGNLSITTEGRALTRGGVGDVIRVLNLSSRATVQGQIMPDGSVHVSPPKG